MPLTITLTRSGVDAGRAEARVDDRPLGTFDPPTLLVDRPFSSESADPVSYGRRLFAALGGDAFAALLADLPYAPDPNSLIALRTADPELAGIPWEYLHGPDTDDEFLILDYLLVREVPGARIPQPPDPTRPWRLVALGSDPLLEEARDPQTGLLARVPLPRLQVVRDLDALRDGLLAQQPPTPLRWQRLAPTRGALIDLTGGDPLLFHYTGHGDIADGKPILCFDDGAGRMDPQPVRELARGLRGRVYLAVLNACRTADVSEPGANLALDLVRGGIPAVLGSQYSVLDEAAAAFAATFYQHLAAGAAPAEALYRARLRLHDAYRGDPSQWGIPALYLAAGFTWPGLPASPPPAPLLPLEPPTPRTLALQAPEREQFLGRERELVDLATLFVQQGARMVTIRGAGGMGKTALAQALCERLRFHFVDGIVALTLALAGEQATLSAATVRRQLATLLGVQERPAFGDPNAADAQEEAIVEVTRGRRALLVLDNYETVQTRLEGEPDAEHEVVAEVSAEQRAEADAVQRLTRRLANASVSLMLTSRQSSVRLPDEQLYPPAERSSQLDGLDHASSHALFRRHARRREHSEHFPAQVAMEVGHSPLN